MSDVKERRDKILRSAGLDTITALAEKAGISVSTLSRNLRSRTMHPRNYTALVKLGIPADCLPRAMNNRPY